MTNEQFWKELDKIKIRTDDDDEGLIHFTELLLQGYRENLELCVILRPDPNDEERGNQLFIGDFDKRFLLCCTSMEKGKYDVQKMDERGMIPDGMELCVTSSPCRDVLHNLFYKREIAALSFNTFSDSPAVVPAMILRPMIKAIGNLKVPDNFKPAAPSRFESEKKRKKAIPIKEWAAQKCPPANLVLILEGKWDTPDEDEEYISKVFCNLWPKIKKYIEKQNKKVGKVSLFDFVLDYPDPDVAAELSTEFLNLMMSVDMYLENTHRYKELIGFCNDLRELFDNSEEEESRITGIIGGALWAQDPAEGEAYFKEHLTEKNDVIMAYYSFCLLTDERWDDAAEALKGYEDSEDEMIIERFKWLKERN